MTCEHLFVLDEADRAICRMDFASIHGSPLLCVFVFRSSLACCPYPRVASNSVPCVRLLCRRESQLSVAPRPASTSHWSRRRRLQSSPKRPPSPRVCFHPGTRSSLGGAVCATERRIGTALHRPIGSGGRLRRPARYRARSGSLARRVRPLACVATLRTRASGAQGLRLGCSLCTKSRCPGTYGSSWRLFAKQRVCRVTSLYRTLQSVASSCASGVTPDLRLAGSLWNTAMSARMGAASPVLGRVAKP